MSWVYLRTEPNLYTVGFYAPDGSWHTDSDWSTKAEAGERVAQLNGSMDDATAIARADRELRRKLEAVTDPKLRAELLRAFEG